MKTLPVLYAASIAQQSMTISYLWRVQRADGAVYGFTDHDKDITFASEVYKASTGMTGSTLQTSLGLTVGDVEASGGLNSVDISEEDILNGKWDHAEFKVMRIDWASPSVAEDVSIGHFGKVSTGVNSYTVECRDIVQFYQAPIGEVSTAGCRVKKLGDARCRVNLAPHTFAGVGVSGVTSRSAFSAASLTQAANWFAFGEMHWQTGANAGLKAEVKAFGAGGIVGLQWPMPHDISIGDTFTIITGCDRTAASCQGKFGNIINFVGELNKPTGDQLTRGPA